MDVKPQKKRVSESDDERGFVSAEEDASGDAQVASSSNKQITKEGPELQDIGRDLPQIDDHNAEDDSAKEEAPTDNKSVWGSWSKWGTSMISTATTSAKSIKSHVGEGLHSVVDAVESTLGAPDPTKLAADDSAKEEHEAEKPEDQVVTAQPNVESEVPSEEPLPQTDKQNESDEPASGWLGSLGWTTEAVQHTGKNILTGGLDVLESIGKKTMNAINEADPGLSVTKAVFKGSKDKAGSSLSQTLIEAKESFEQAENLEVKSDLKKANFNCLFDEHQGIAHLEALEMISQVSKEHVAEKLDASDPDFEAIVDSLSQAFNVDLEDLELDTVDETRNNFSEQLTNSCHLLNLSATQSIDRLIQVHEESSSADISALLQNEGATVSEEPSSVMKVHRSAVNSLASMAANCVELFHRIAESFTLATNTSAGADKIAKSLIVLVRVIHTELNDMATRYVDALQEYSQAPSSVTNNSEFTHNVKPVITDIFLEAGTASKYTQQCFMLLLPVLQASCIQK